MSSQYGELQPLAAEMLASLGHTCKFQWDSRLGSIIARTLCASAKCCGVEQRAPTIFGRVAITLGIGPHSSPV